MFVTRNLILVEMWRACNDDQIFVALTSGVIVGGAPVNRLASKSLIRVPTRPGKMRVHLENLEISWIIEKFNKYHGKMT